MNVHQEQRFDPCFANRIRFTRLQFVPLFLSLCRRTLCQTLSRTLDKSRKTPQTSEGGLESKAVKTLCVIL